MQKEIVYLVYKEYPNSTSTFLGVYSTKESAEEAKKRYISDDTLSVTSLYDADYLYIEEFVVGEDRFS